MRGIALKGTVLALAGSLLLIPTGTATADPVTAVANAPSTSVDQAAQAAQAPVVQVAKARKKKGTRFALAANAFSTRIRGGDIPVASGTTAWRALGCTNVVGLNKTNAEAEVDIPGLGKINALKSRVWSTKKGRTVTAHSLNTIAGITLADVPVVGKLEITGVRSYARAFHNRSGFHARGFTKVLGLRLTRPGGNPIELDLPSPGNPIVVPGVLKVSLGHTTKTEKNNWSQARSSGLLVNLIPTDTVIRVASARSRISNGVRRGLFNGFSAGLRADVLEPLVKVGRTPLLPMPCVGTRGKIRKRPVAGVNIPGVLNVGAVTTRQRGKQTKRGGRGFTEAKLANVSLLGGRLKIEGVTARANVVRKGNKVRRNAKGTDTLRVTLDGEEIKLPNLGTIEIPGILKISTRVVKRTRNQVKVVALRVELLDGTVGTVDIGIAELRIRKAPR